VSHSAGRGHSVTALAMRPVTISVVDRSVWSWKGPARLVSASRRWGAFLLAFGAER
jgi:hypothetical protein